MAFGSKCLQQKHPKVRHEILGNPVIGVVEENAHVIPASVSGSLGQPFPGKWPRESRIDSMDPSRNSCRYVHSIRRMPEIMVSATLFGARRGSTAGNKIASASRGARTKRVGLAPEIVRGARDYRSAGGGAHRRSVRRAGRSRGASPRRPPWHRSRWRSGAIFRQGRCRWCGGPECGRQKQKASAACEGHDYSYRNATVGSTRVARSAGM